MPNPSANWRRGHPWATLYHFVVEREPLARPAGLLLFGTDTRRLFTGLDAIDDVPDGGAILDIPCGGGVALRGLEPDRRLRYVAADISRSALEQAAAAARERDLDQVETCLADAERLPFDDASFDLCLSFAGLHCFPHPHLAVREIARCLKPRGRFVGSIFPTDSLRYRPYALIGRAIGIMGPSGGRRDVERWFGDAGLTLTAFERSGALAYFSAAR